MVSGKTQVQRKVVLLGAASLLAGLAGPALAQSRQPPGMGPTEAFGGRAPRDVTEELGGRLVAAVRYDPQAARGNDMVASARNLLQEELIYTTSGNLLAGRRFGGFAVNLTADVDLEWHQKNESLDTRAYGVNSEVSRPVGPCAVGSAGGYERRERLLEQADLSYVRNTQELTNLAFYANCSGLAGIQAGVTSAFSEDDNSLPASRSSKNRLVTANLGYGNQVLGAIDAYVTVSDSNYEGGVLAGLASATGVETTSYGLRYSRPLLQNLTGEIRGGYTITDPDGVPGSDETDFSANARLTYKSRQGLLLDLAYDRDARASNLRGTAYNYSERFDLNVGYTLGQGLALRATATSGFSRYRGQLVLPSRALSDIRDLTKTRDNNYGLSAAYPIGERIRTSLRYSYGRSKVNSLIPLGLSPISQLTRQTNQAVTGSVGVTLPFDSVLALDLTYEQRKASDDAFSYKAFKGGVSLRVEF